MSTYPGVYIVEKSALSLGTSGMSDLTPLLIGRFKKKNNKERNLADGLIKVNNFVEFSERFITTSLVVTLTNTGVLYTPPPADEDAEASDTDTIDGDTAEDNVKAVKPKAKKTSAKNAKAEASAPVEDENERAEAGEQDPAPAIPIVLNESHLNLSALAVANYFNNGGGPCYLLSLGERDSATGVEAQIQQYSELSLLAVIDAKDDATISSINEVLGRFIQANQQSFMLASIAVPSNNSVPAIPDYLNPERTAVYTPDLRLPPPPMLSDNDIFIAPTDSAEDPKLLTDYDKNEKDGIYEKVKTALHRNGVNYSAVIDPVISPLAAVAGAYCRTERDRGIWKAPANVSLIGATPAKAIGKETHGKLNQAGINAIIWQPSTRSTTIMGARTQSPVTQTAWRYIPVRLLFNIVERDIRNMLIPVVFEPNSAATWQSVLAAINNYLFKLWKKGGLEGNTPQQAYQVALALEEDDIDNGILRVRVGLAALRPVEFIYLEFTQDMPVTA